MVALIHLSDATEQLDKIQAHLSGMADSAALFGLSQMEQSLRDVSGQCSFALAMLSDAFKVVNSLVPNVSPGQEHVDLATPDYSVTPNTPPARASAQRVSIGNFGELAPHVEAILTGSFDLAIQPTNPRKV